MNILFINLPYYGHVVPTIGLVQELIKQGNTVTYLLPHDWKDTIKESNATFYGYDNHKQLAEQIKNAYKTAKSIINNYDLVIYEQFFFLGKHLAETHHKPVVRIFTAPIANHQLMNEYIQSGPLAIFKNKWLTKAFTKDIAKNIQLKTDNWLDEIIENPPALNLIYTLREYQPYQEEYDDIHYKFLGPSIYQRKEIVFNYTKKKTLIYISLGTIVKGANKFFKTCIDTFKDLDVEVIISTKHKIKNIPSNIHIYSHVPQLHVLQMADVFITHGGMNSINEALTYKVPMIIIPFASDQPVNARSMEKLNVSRTLLPNEVTKDNLQQAVQEVLNNKEIQDNLNTIHKRILQANGNAMGVKYIEEYYKGVK